MKRNRNLKTFLKALAAIALMAIILMDVNVLVKPLNLRLDCTEDKRFTLSPGTKQILAQINEPVSLRFYYSKDAAQMPVTIKNYAARVQDMLREYKHYAGDRLDLKYLNPAPDSEEEDAAKLDRIAKTSLNPFATEQVYFGLAVSCGEQTETIPFLDPQREALLEYDLTRTIIAVTQEVKTKVGIISPLHLTGGYTQQQLLMQMQGQQTRPLPPWFLVQSLKQTYDVQEISTSAQTIPPDITVLMVVHPKQLPEQTLYALDQFVLRGGRLIVCVDPLSILDLQMQAAQLQRFQQPEVASNLKTLFDAWGVRFHDQEVVLDRKAASQIGRIAQPAALLLHRDMDNFADDIVTRPIKSMLMPYAGAFTITPMDGIDQTPLITTTTEVSSMPTDMVLRTPPDQILKNFKPTGKPKTLAVRLSGHFKTAFPQGRPSEKAKETQPQPPNTQLRESTGESHVVLVGDVDCLFDAFLYQKTTQGIRSFHNLPFALNLVDHMAGDEALFSIRSRAGTARPFTVIRDMETKVREQFQAKEAELEKAQRDTQEKIIALQRTRSQHDQDLLSASQKQELLNYSQREAEIQQNLKKVRKELREDVERLENNLTIINIALMPLCVILAGMVVALVKTVRRKQP